jgi:hypothetical protein
MLVSFELFFFPAECANCYYSKSDHFEDWHFLLVRLSFADHKNCVPCWSILMNFEDSGLLGCDPVTLRVRNSGRFERT